MRVIGYAYPWDVAEPGFIERVQHLDADQIAVASSYHSARAATPWAEKTTAVHAETAAFYRPVEEQEWDRLRPAAPVWVPGRDSFGDAVSVLSSADIPASAWVVLTHNSYVGGLSPDVVVQNCFGESYPWAMCPAHPDVRRYAEELVAGTVRDVELSGVILESCGQMGVVHQSRHEKTDGVWSPAAARLLSVCCCTTCENDWTRPGEEVRQTLRREVRRLLAVDLQTDTTRLDQELLAELLANRQSNTDALRRQVLEQVPNDHWVTLHASLDPWATGALPGLTPQAAEQVESVVVQCWTPSPETLSMVEQTRAQLPDDVSLGVYITAVSGQPVPDIQSYVRRLCDSGADELHLYHLGLAGPSRWPDLVTAARTATAVR